MWILIAAKLQEYINNALAEFQKLKATRPDQILQHFQQGMDGAEFVDTVAQLNLKHIVDLVIKGNSDTICKCFIRAPQG